MHEVEVSSQGTGAPRLIACPYCGGKMVAQWNADVAVKYCWSHAEFQAVCGSCRARGPAVLVPRDGIGAYGAGIAAAEQACQARRAPEPQAKGSPAEAPTAAPEGTQ